MREEEKEQDFLNACLNKIKTLNNTVPCLALRVIKNQTCFIKNSPNIKKYLLTNERHANVMPDPNDASFRLILLNPTFQKEDLSDDFLQWIQQQSITLLNHPITKGYNELSYTEILRCILPEHVVIPTAFERIGHIVHLNLCNEQLKYKKIIAQIILDKHPGIKTVVTKTNSITSLFRTCELELLAGEDNYITEMVESSVRFYIDYKNVYWNSRLSGERQRINQVIPNGSIVCDVMAGVGAFSMHLAKRGCYILANDYNKRATECIDINTVKNKVFYFVKSFHMEGCQFLSYCLSTLNILNPLNGQLQDIFNKTDNAEPSLTSSLTQRKRARTDSFLPCSNTPCLTSYAQVHFIMNLPHQALEFLDEFKNYYSTESCSCIVHCYCFAHPTKFQEEIHTQLVTYYGEVPSQCNIIDVRNVAPNKHMFCVEFEIKKNNSET